MAKKSQLNLEALDQLIEKIDKVYAKINQLESKIDALNKKTIAPKIDPGLAKTIDELAKSLSGFRADAGAADSISKTLKDVSTSIKSLNDLAVEGVNKKGIQKLAKTFSDFMKPFADLTKNLGKFNLASEFPKIVNSVSDAISALGKMDNIAEKVTRKDVSRTIRYLKRIIKDVAGLAKTKVPADGLSNFRAIGEILRAVGNLMSSLRLALESQAVINASGFFSRVKILSLIGKSVKTVVNSFRGIASERLVALAPAIKAIGTLFASLDKIITNVGSQRALDERALKKNIRIVTSVFSELKKLRVSQAKDLTPLLEVISKLFTSLSKLNVGKQADKTALSFKTAFLDLRDAINLLGKIKIPRKTLKSLADFLGAFAKLPNVDYGGIASITKSFTELGTMKDLKGSDFKWVRELFKDLSKGLAEFNRVKVDGKKLESAAALIKRIQEIQATAATKGVDLLGQALSNQRSRILAAIEFGFFTEVGRKIANALFGGLKNLRPDIALRSLFNGFATFTNRVVGLFRNMQLSINQVFDGLKRNAESFTRLGQGLLRNFGIGRFLGSTLASLKVNAFETAAEFDELSTQLQVFGRLTDDDLVKAQEFADQIGIQYPLSANEALKAILDLSKAGQSLPNIERILPSAADLAALSDSKSIEASTQLLIGAQASFKEFADGIPATFENVDIAADLVANTADATTASVEDIQASLQNLGPIASQYGLSFADVNAIIGTFADSNLKGAEAGTALKSALSNLTTTTAKNELAKLGVSLTDAQGNFRDFNDIIVDINEALNSTKTIRFNQIPGVSKENEEQVKAATRALENAQRQLFLWQNQLASGSGDPEKQAEKVAEYERQIAAAQNSLTQLTGSQQASRIITAEVTRTQLQNAESIKALFGSYGQVAGSILLTAGGFGDLRDQIQNSGTASERAQKLMDNFRGDVEQLKGSIETLLKNAMLPLIEKFFRPFIRLGRFVVDALLNMDQRVLEFIMTGVALVSTFATIAGVIAVAIGAFATVGVYAIALVSALTSIITVAGTLLVSIGSLAAGFIVIAGALTGIVAVVGVVTAVFEGLRRIFSDDLGGARTAFVGFLNEVKGAAGAALGVLQAFGDLIVAIFSSGIGTGLESTGKQIAGFFNSITSSGKIQSAKAFFEDATGILKTFSSALTLDAQVEEAGNSTRRRLGELARNMDISGEEIDLAVQSSREKVQKSFDEMAAALLENKLFQRILGKNLLTRDDVQKALSGFLFFVFELRAATSKLFGAFTAFFGNIQKLGFGRAFDQMTKDLESGLKGVAKVLLTGLGRLLNFDVSKEISTLNTAGLTDALAVLFQRALERVKTALLAHRGDVVKVLRSVFGFFFAPLKSIGFVSKLFGLDSVTNIVEHIQDVIGNAFEGVINTIFNILEGQSIGEAIINAFGPGVKPIVDFARALINVGKQIFGAFKGVFDTISSVLSGGLVGDIPFVDAIGNIFTKLTEFINSFSRDVLGNLLSGNIGSGLIEFGQLINSTFLQKIGEAFQTGDYGTVIFTVASEIWNFLKGAVEKVPELIDGLGDLLNAPFLNKVADNLREGDFGGIISDIAGGVWDVLRSALEAVPDLILDLVQVLGIPFFSEIATAIETGDWTDIQNRITAAIGDVIQLALDGVKQIPSLVSAIGTTLNSPLLVMIADDLDNGDWTSIIDRIVTALADLLRDVFGAIPGTLTNIGTIFSIPVLGEIATDLETGNFENITDRMAEAVRDLVRDALGKVPELLGSIADLLDIGWLADFSLDLQDSLAFKVFTEALANISAYPLEVIGAGLEAIKNALNYIEVDPARALSLSLILGAIAAFAAKEAIITAVARAMDLLATKFSVFLSKALAMAGIAATIIILKNALEALGTLLSGDIWGGLGEILVGIADDILSMTGLKVVLEEKLGLNLDPEALLASWRAIPNMIEIIINDAAERMSTGIRNILDGLLLAAVSTAARIQLLGGISREGFGVDWAKIDENVNKFQQAIAQSGTVGDLGFSAMSQEAFRVIGDVITNPANAEFVAAQLRTVFPQIMEAFQKTDFRSLVKGDANQQRAAADIFSALIAADGLVEGAAFIGQQYGPEVLDAMLTNLLEFRPGALTNVDGQQLLTELFRKSLAGQVGGGVAIDIADMLVLTGKITPTQYDQFVKDLETQIGELAGTTPEKVDSDTVKASGGFGGVQVPVEVTPTVEIQPDAGTTVQTEATQLVNEQIANTPPTEGTEVTVPVAPEVELPTSPEEMALFSSQIADVKTKLAELQAKFIEFATNAQPTVDKINEMSAKLVDLKTKSSETFTSVSTDLSTFVTTLQTHVDTTVVPKLKEIIDQIFAIDVKILGWVLVMPINLNLNANAWDGWARRVKTNLNDVKDMIKTIDDAVIRATNNINTLNGTDVGNPFEGGGGNPPGRAGGGPVSGRRLYEVIEQGIPELLHSGGRTYLIPASNGQITPLAQLGTGSMQRGLSSLPASMGRAGSPLTNSTSNVNITEGDIVIQINGANAANPAALAATVRAEVRAELDNRNTRVRSTLRTGHR